MSFVLERDNSHASRMNLEAKIGSRLRALRHGASITPEAAAAAAELNVQHYLECEAGKRRASAIELTRLCRLFGASMVELFRSE